MTSFKPRRPRERASLIRCLALAAVFGLAAATEAQQPASDLRSAAAAAATAAEAKDWPRAEAGYREAARLAAERLKAEPQSLDLAATRDTLEYNAACAAALQGRDDAAFELLAGLLDRSWYDNSDLLATDPDLASLRRDAARFGALQERARQVLAEACAGHAEGRLLLPKRGVRGKARVPGLVALHGGGGSVEDWEGAWQPVADRLGVVVILVRGSIVQGKGAFSYDQRRPARDAARIEEWLAKARAAAPALDENELFLAGFSQGGGMTWVLGLEGERAWRGLVPMGGYVQIAAREGVMAKPRSPVAAYAIVGEKDEAAIIEMNEKLAARPKADGLRVHLERIPGAGHALPADLPAALQRAMRWCRRAPGAR